MDFGEIGTLARTRNNSELAKTTSVLLLASNFYDILLENNTNKEYERRVEDSETLLNPDEVILFSYVVDQDLLDFIDSNTVSRGTLYQFLRRLLNDQELQIQPQRFSNFSHELAEYLERSHMSEKEDIINNEKYGIEQAIFRIKETAGEEESDILETSLNILLDIHKETQDFPTDELR